MLTTAQIKTYIEQTIFPTLPKIQPKPFSSGTYLAPSLTQDDFATLKYVIESMVEDFCEHDGFQYADEKTDVRWWCAPPWPSRDDSERWSILLACCAPGKEPQPEQYMPAGE